MAMVMYTSPAWVLVNPIGPVRYRPRTGPQTPQMAYWNSIVRDSRVYSSGLIRAPGFGVTRMAWLYPAGASRSSAGRARRVTPLAPSGVRGTDLPRPTRVGAGRVR